MCINLLKIIIGLGCLLAINNTYAQHDAHYTNFMFQKLAINPAYAGSHGALTTTAVYRNQWSGIEGAPKTISISGHAPILYERAGIGLGIIHDQIGIMRTTKLDVSYAYRMALNKKTILSLALNGQVENIALDWSKSEVVDEDDDMVPTEQESNFKPNFGAGIYLDASNFYVGISMPAMFKNGLYYNREAWERNFRTAYLMAGWITELTEQVKFKPSALVRFNNNAPVTIDLNANFLFMDVLWIGASYRLGDSIDGLVQYQINKQLRAGIGLDFTLSELQNHTMGSYELMLEYTFDFKDPEAQNLRYF